MTGRARVGCSGWSYKEWRGVVYPADAPARRWFELYAERFDTVEINNTFYRLPEASTVEGWAAQAPPGFTYRSEEHTSELQSLMRISYAVFCLKKKKIHKTKIQQ